MLLPRADRTEPFWLSERDDAVADMQTRPALPHEVDIVVVGSGLSGALAVHHLTKAGPGERRGGQQQVLLLDAQRLCEGATARNGGHCKPLTYLGFRAEAARHGARVADEMYSFEAGHLAVYAELVRSEDLDCDMHVTRACDVFMDAADAAEAKRDYDERKRLFPASMARDDIREVSDVDELARMTGIKGGKWGCHYPAGHLWPYKLATQLITKSVARARGKLDVFTHTPVHRIDTGPTRQGYTVVTDKGPVRTQSIIVCANAWTAGILPQFQDKIVPVRGTVCSVRPSANHQIGSQEGYGPLKMTYGIRHGPGEMDYTIPRQGRGRVPGMGDQSLILGGAKGVFNRDLAAWYNNNDDATLIPGTRQYFSGLLTRIFKDWKVQDGQGEVERIWTGVLGYSHDLLPYVGRMGPGLYVSAGFTGHGMPRIPACSEAIAHMALSELRQGTTPSTASVEAFGSAVPAPYHFAARRLASPVNRILGALGVPERAAARESSL